MLPLLGGCRSEPRLNIVLFSIDIIRADHLWRQGGQIRTPNLDALAQQSRRYEWCFSAVPITLPSHTTMLTGLYPNHHSARDNSTFIVPDSVPTLAAHGWTTIGVIGAFPITARSGLARGFQVWDEELDQSSGDLLPLAFTQRSADSVTRAVLRNWRGRPVTNRCS